MGWRSWLTGVVLHPVTAVALGSAAGGTLRYLLGAWIHSLKWPGGLPWGTMVINVSGSFLLGFFASAFLEHIDRKNVEAYLLLGTGFCGGYTTFSTFELETYRLIKEGNWNGAIVNVAGSVVAGFLAVAAGVYIGHLLFGKTEP